MMALQDDRRHLAQEQGGGNDTYVVSENTWLVYRGCVAAGNDAPFVTHDNSTFRLTAKSDVPIGHKVALKDLKDGETAIKYGEDIGKVIAPIVCGEHVHVHNIKTKRW